VPRPRLAAVVVSAALVLTPAAAAEAHQAKPKPSPDGHYVGTADPDVLKIDLKVTGHGKKVKALHVGFTSVCSYPLGPGPYVPLTFKPMKIKGNGTFRYYYEDESGPDSEDVRIQVSGRVKGHKIVDGVFSWEAGYCSEGDVDDPVTWTAKRG
jgi:opacity protein-like surface antigen